MRSYSDGTGSLTLRIMSAASHTSRAEGTNSAPARAYRSDDSDDPAPASCSTTTRCPAAVSSRAPSGVRATRYSLSLTSLGTPTITGCSSLVGSRSKHTGAGEAVQGAADGTSG